MERKNKTETKAKTKKAACGVIRLWEKSKSKTKTEAKAKSRRLRVGCVVGVRDARSRAYTLRTIGVLLFDASNCAKCDLKPMLEPNMLDANIHSRILVKYMLRP